MTQVRTRSGDVEGASVHGLREWAPDLTQVERRGRALVEERPLVALMVALAGGYCLGRMLSRV